MSKAQERRTLQRARLIDAAERQIAAEGLSGLSTRDLARAVGVANGAVYNLVEDRDDLILLVGSRTLQRLDAWLTEAERTVADAPPVERLVAISQAYAWFARDNLELWRALFEHRMAPGKPTPEWSVTEQMSVFAHVLGPLRDIFPNLDEPALGLAARSLFSAVHGIVALGLEQKLVAVPPDILQDQLATMARAMIAGLKA